MTDRRTVMVAARVTPAEHAAWQDKAAAGVSPSALLREAMTRTRTWTASARAIERKRTRQLARIGNNLNQLVRWANTHKEAAEAVTVIANLVSFERCSPWPASTGTAAMHLKVPAARQGLGPGGGRLSRRRPRRRWAQARGRRGSARESGHGGRRRRLAGVRAQVHVGRDRVGAGRPADRGTNRSGPRRVREDGVGGTEAGPLTRVRPSCTASVAAASTCISSPRSAIWRRAEASTSHRPAGRGPSTRCATPSTTSTAGAARTTRRGPGRSSRATWPTSRHRSCGPGSNTKPTRAN